MIDFKIQIWYNLEHKVRIGTRRDFVFMYEKEKKVNISNNIKRKRENII